MAGCRVGLRDWRRGLFAVSIVPAFWIVVIGTIAQRDQALLPILALLYGLWTVLFGISVCLCHLGLSKFSDFILTSVYYLICIAITLAFFASLRTIDSNSLYLWVPICVDLGIFVGIGVVECVSLCSRARVRQFLLGTSTPLPLGPTDSASSDQNMRRPHILADVPSPARYSVAVGGSASGQGLGPRRGDDGSRR
ncbi:hypothetical protein F4677DRAFT_39182 [Hypoxylon crocopeplum]|nr:hypothetical protein F4677DRAFT_39182 [Hypoxylon crocopeplum]